MNGTKSIAGFVLGFVFGSLIGMVVGILLAPQSGEETRDLLKEKGIELRVRTEELSEEGRARLQEAIEQGKITATRRKEELTKALEEEKEVKKPRAKKAKA